MHSIKRHPAIVSFSRDHHFGLLLVWKIRQGLKKSVNAERIGNYVLFYYNEELENHFEQEEQLLFCRLPIGDALRVQAESEHLILRKQIRKIAENKNDAALLERFALTLEKHIRFEERELFNHLQKVITQEDLITIAERLSNNSKAVDDKWNDIFWNKNK